MELQLKGFRQRSEAGTRQSWREIGRRAGLGRRDTGEGVDEGRRRYGKVGRREGYRQEREDDKVRPREGTGRRRDVCRGGR